MLLPASEDSSITDSATDSARSAVPGGVRILIVEDETAIVEAVAYNLRLQGHTPITAGDADTALRLLREKQPELVILDIMLPSGSGFDICRLIRQSGNNVPILMLTARVAEADRVYGLEIGADDYLIKPFGMRELMARVMALLRRGTTPPGTSPENTSAHTITAPGIGLVIDIERREIRKNGTSLTLSRKEFDLISLMATHPGRVFDRQTLLDRVWGEDAYVDDRTVDVHIRWLREKIEPIPSKPQFLLTVRGIGYKFQG